MPPLGKCLRRINPSAAMVDGFIETKLNTNKTQILPSNYGTFRLLVVCENFNPKSKPLLSSSMQRALFKCETPRLELKSLRSQSKKVIKLAGSLLIKVAHILCANRDIPV
jgi:hypothetical protein